MITNSLGKKNCFNCGMDDHWVVNCPDLSQAQRKELAGMAHISIGGKEFNYDDDVEQTKTHPLLLLQDECPKLSPKRMNDGLYKTPIIHPRIVLGLKDPVPQNLFLGLAPYLLPRD